MPLSEYEKQVLAQMERQLASDDPKLASRLGEESRPRIGRVIIGILGIVVGLVILVVAVMTYAWLGVIGFLVMLAGAWFALMKKRPDAAAQPAAGTGAHGPAAQATPVKKARRDSFMARMEARWDKRRNQGML